MAPTNPRPPARKPRSQYHHGDLRRALVEEAVRTIQTRGAEALTLREVGRRLGVSRTALYRHFADKAALLAAVGREGFRTFREELQKAVRSHGGGQEGFEAMGRAYVQFAMTHPAHYRVMFGGFLAACDHEPELAEEAAGSFRVLLDAVVAGQQAGMLRADDSGRLARYVWAVVHGIAMLAIDGQLKDANVDDEVTYAMGRIGRGIAK